MTPAKPAGIIYLVEKYRRSVTQVCQIEIECRAGIYPFIIVTKCPQLCVG